ncbi:NAD(P)-binding protein [Jackrogersella minutella]|nr:NAD(P)-binding protein [Jackrogersella minutella]
MPILTGKVILITGVDLLARRNPARIYIIGRNAEGAENVIQKVRREIPESKTEIKFIKCDLTIRSSVKQVAEYLPSQESRLDVLRANAGIMATPPGLTKDGYEVQFGTNHLGHTLHYPQNGGVVFDELKTRQDYWVLGPRQRYGQSKLANILYARELARRYPSITSLAIHPGTTPTSLIGSLSCKNKFITVEQGPCSQVWAVGAPKSKAVSGNSYQPVGVNPEDILTPHALDRKLAEKLWDWTEKEINSYL